MKNDTTVGYWALLRARLEEENLLDVNNPKRDLLWTIVRNRCKGESESTTEAIYVEMVELIQ